MLFFLIVSVLSATAEGPQGAAERQRDVADIEAAETPGEGTAEPACP